MTDSFPGRGFGVIQEATEDNPLEVCEYAAVPIMLSGGGDEAVLRQTVQCVRDGPWAAILVPCPAQKESDYAWKIHAWYTNHLLSMEDQLNETPVTTIPLSNDFATPPLLAIHHAAGASSSRSISTSTAAVAFVYVLDAETGNLYGHRVAANAQSKSTPASRRPIATTLPLEEEDRVNVLVAADANAQHHVLFAATKQGKVFRVQPRPATHSILYQDVTADVQEQSRSMFRFFGSSSTAPHTDIQYLVPATEGSFWTVSRDALQFWQASINTSSTVTQLKTVYTLGVRLPASHDSLPTNFAIERLAQAEDNVIHLLGTAPDQETSDLKWYTVRWQYQNDEWKVVNLTWLNRLSDSATCLAWQAAQNSVAWGEFLPYKDMPIERNIVFSIVPKNGKQTVDDISVPSVIYEYDGVLGDPFVPGSFQADYTTHGVTFSSRSGNWLRVECLDDTQTGPTQMASLSLTDQRRLETTLFLHLKSTFQSYEHARGSHQDPGVPLPPSFKHPDAIAVQDQVVTKLGLEHLPKDSDRGDSNKHVMYLDCLKHVGLYRSLKPVTKCWLLAFGEEIAADTDLIRSDSIPEGLRPKHGIAQWMELYQNRFVLQHQTPEQWNLWTSILAASLKAVRVYRDENKQSRFQNKHAHVQDMLYTLSNIQKREDIPSWLSHPALQRTLLNFVKHQDGLRFLSQFVLTPEMEEILHASLDSFNLSFCLMPESAEIRSEYARLQKQVIKLFCTDKEKVAEAWDLSVKHKYFSGLCELAREYEKEPDSPFQLQPLFAELSSARDVETGLAFGPFVLQWHIDRKLFGHALEYGEECPSDLKQMAENDPLLEPFRWIVGIRNGKFDEAAQSLIRNAAEDVATVSQTKISMGFAKMANSLVERDHDAVRGGKASRDAVIEKIRERANAQEELFGGTKEAQSGLLKSADELLNYAISQLGHQDTVERKILTCVRALAVCTTFDTSSDAQGGAARVWLEALRSDYRYFKEFVFNSASIDTTAVYSSTVFGGLFAEASQTPEWNEVMCVAGSRVFEGVLEGLVPQDQSGLRLLLRALSSN